MGAVMRNVRHGGPYDRGSADAYYRRPFDPHYYRGATYTTPRVDQIDMTTEELVEYELGWDEVHEAGIYK